MKNTKVRLHRLQKSQNVDRVTIDIGSVAATGVPAAGRAYQQLRRKGAIDGLADPVCQAVSLTATAASTLGSDYARCDLVFDGPHPTTQAGFNDHFGVTWQWTDGRAAPLLHPLQKTRYRDIHNLPKPKLPGKVLFPDKGHVKKTGMAVVCDAPVPGLLELCFRLRGQQQFLGDLSAEPRAAHALLDWAVEAICNAYEGVLEELPHAPDFLVYDDDLGHRLGMFISEEQFQTYFKPRMATVIARLRARSAAGIIYHSRGAISPVLKDICDLGISLLSVRPAAAGMGIEEMRRQIPESLVLHGVTNFEKLCKALRTGHADGLLDIAYSLAIAWPVVAAPTERLSASITVDDLAWASSFMKALDLGKKTSRSEIIAERGTLHRALSEVRSRTKRDRQADRNFREPLNKSCGLALWREGRRCKAQDRGCSTAEPCRPLSKPSPRALGQITRG